MAVLFFSLNEKTMSIALPPINEYFQTSVVFLTEFLRHAGEIFQVISEVFEMLGDFFKIVMECFRDFLP
ncbi:MAG: hypothetical protein COT84_03875 [Chlamydiae bacterium CG10_big_fil_rev_8_21_14_0_10_35_9]|nr:MAG: hypothetical protein COT84_03875 [Chlamydiae bacterium CG10_big_fil_rev_8_21_14_0_10_35_9]